MNNITIDLDASNEQLEIDFECKPEEKKTKEKKTKKNMKTYQFKLCPMSKDNKTLLDNQLHIARRVYNWGIKHLTRRYNFYTIIPI